MRETKKAKSCKKGKKPGLSAFLQLFALVIAQVSLPRKRRRACRVSSQEIDS
jgi:hypothetical protein